MINASKRKCLYSVKNSDQFLAKIQALGQPFDVISVNVKICLLINGRTLRGSMKLMNPVVKFTEWFPILAASVASWLRTMRARRRVAPPSELQQGSGGGAPSGVQGQSPWRGARGAEPPGKFFEFYM